MSLLPVVIMILLAGAIGGVFNAIVLEGGFKQGGWTANKIWSLGFTSNILCGAFAAFVSWGLYGPLSSVDLLQTNTPQLTLAALCGAALTGFSGASWLTSQVDKNVWKTTAITAMEAPRSPEAAAQMAKQTPQEALNTAKTVRRQPDFEEELPPDTPILNPSRS